MDLFSDTTLTLIEKLLTLLGAGIATLAAVIVKSASGKVEKLSSGMDDHEKRITVLECTTVTRESLIEIVDLLRHDLKDSFARTHERIDALHSKERGSH